MFNSFQIVKILFIQGNFLILFKDLTEFSTFNSTFFHFYVKNPFENRKMLKTMLIQLKTQYDKSRL